MRNKILIERLDIVTLNSGGAREKIRIYLIFNKLPLFPTAVRTNARRHKLAGISRQRARGQRDALGRPGGWMDKWGIF